MLFLIVGSAQGNKLVKDDFVFTDGLYLNYDSFRSDSPDHDWSEVKAELAINPKTLVAQVEYIIPVEAGVSPFLLDSIWGFALDGIAYRRIHPDSTNKPAAAFAGLQPVGRICYYAYERDTTRTIEISAYNPLTGRPFRTAREKRTETQLQERMLRFTDGRIARFDRDSFLNWTRKDETFWRQASRLDSLTAERRLFDLLLRFNQRNPVHIEKK